ncbi:hypothetical protein H2199_003290 [Coniosporium tulheliwenetii]|uniref:Uncharacterized protein n=1 Tax=Coniosporium tulheliwenetii TaxID=3383036 RepID=A0ACC2ZCH0_9PEZI|nr:hypothetical protein H2199_003290 [Cladosporium sp. JES 115]
MTVGKVDEARRWLVVVRSRVFCLAPRFRADDNAGNIWAAVDWSSMQPKDDITTAIEAAECPTGGCLIIAQSSASPPQRRRIHHVPKLINDEQHDFKNNGVPGLLSPDAFEIAWTHRQAMLVDKLNTLTQGPHPILRARPQPSLLFNHASAAFNNHFFFKGLAIDKTPIPSTLQAHLVQSFSSIDTLRKEFIATANAMFGPGFVWLVRRKHRVSAEQFQILTTYLAGSPLPGHTGASNPST